MVRGEILKNGTKVFTSETHRVNADGPLLAAFIEPKGGERLLDMCSGSGIVPLWLYDRGFRGETAAVEIQPDAAALFKKAVRANQIDSISILEMDHRDFSGARKFDIVSCNAPYFTDKNGALSREPGRAAARSAAENSVFDMAVSAARNLKEGGRFCCCWPPGRAESLFAALRQAQLSLKRLRLCRHSESKPPWLMLVEARLRGGEGLRVLDDFIAEYGGEKTGEYREIFT